MRNGLVCFAVLAVVLLVPQAGSAIQKRVDLTTLSPAGGVDGDRLRVAGLTQSRLADDAIERVAVAGLRRAKDLQGCTFAVETRSGIVYLLGEVDKERQKASAIHLVAAIDGVTAVRSGLTRRRGAK